MLVDRRYARDCSGHRGCRGNRFIVFGCLKTGFLPVVGAGMTATERATASNQHLVAVMPAPTRNLICAESLSRWQGIQQFANRPAGDIAGKMSADMFLATLRQ